MASLAEIMAMVSRPDLEIDLLRSFTLIAESGSFTRAAERVGRSQSAVSLQVQRLEALVGHRLFSRGKGAIVRLTPKGRDLLGPARELLFLNDETVRALRTMPRRADRDSNRAGSAVIEGPVEAGKSRDMPSIAVLPFRNISGDPEQDYFAAGIVEDIVAALSRITWLSVTKRQTGFSRGDGVMEPSKLLRDFGVRYALLGGVRKAGGRVRITARLLEAGTGRQLWADRYDGALDRVFDLQDQIADQIAGVVEPSLRRAETKRSRRKRTDSLDAYDCYLRALPHVAEQMPGKASLAIPLLDRALKLDPDYSAAHALIAWCHELCFARGGFEEAHRSAALRHAGIVLDGDTDDGTPLAVAGFVTTLLTADRDAALGAIDRGVAMNPSSTTALLLGAQAHALAGECELAESFSDRALSLNPVDPLAFEAHMALGEAAVQDDRYDDASACFARAARAKPSFSTAYIYQAMALAQAGHVDRATNPLRRGFELEPAFSTRAFHEHHLADPLRERWVEGSRLLNLTA